MNTKIIQGYEEAARGDFIQRVEAISSAELLAPVREHFPEHPCRILDVGAGTGRDAAWLASQSHLVVAAEPVDALREAGKAKHVSPNITWVKDWLPDLKHTSALGLKFEIILMSAVWQHLDDVDRQKAFSTLRSLLTDEGRLIMSIRQGPGAAGRHVFPTDIVENVSWAEANGFSKDDQIAAESVQ